MDPVEAPYYGPTVALLKDKSMGIKDLDSDHGSTSQLHDTSILQISFSFLFFIWNIGTIGDSQNAFHKEKMA